MGIQKISCRNRQDFVKRLLEDYKRDLADKSRSAKIEDGLRPLPRYKLAKTGISGDSLYYDITVWFPNGIFPLSPKRYTTLQESLREIAVELDNEPELVVSKPVWNYTLWLAGVPRTYKDKKPDTPAFARAYFEDSNGQIGFLRDNSEGRVHLMLHGRILATDTQKAGRILETILGEVAPQA